MLNFILSGFADEIDKDLSIQMRELKKNGIKHIEIRGVNGRNVVDYSAQEMKEIKKQLDDEGISVSAVGSPLGKIPITDPFDQHLDLFKHTLELCGILNSKFIRMFSFYIPEGKDPGNYRGEVLERWHQFTRTAENAGVVLAHENEKGIYGDTAERCLDIIREMNCSHVKAVFDPANFIQCDVKTYPDAYMLLKEHIAYMHIKDAIYADGKVVPAGAGDGRLKEILSDLHRSFDGDMFLSLEPHLGSFDGLADLGINIDISKMEQSGPGKFMLAASSLKELLDSAGIDYR